MDWTNAGRAPHVARSIPGKSLVPWAALFLFASFAVTDVGAQGLRSRDAWQVLVPHSRPVDCVVWQGRIVVADDGGGLLLVDPTDSSVETWTTREGLTSNLVTSVDVDSSGQLWVGTRGGAITRIDGAGSARRVTGLLSSAVTDLAVDGDLVYYGTLSGAGRVANGFAEQVFQASDGLPSDEIRVVAAYGGLAWFGTPNGVGRFDRSTNEIRIVNDGLGTNLEVFDLRAGGSGAFVSTADGVFRFDGTQWVPLPPPPTAIRRLVLVSQGLLGIAAGDRAWILDLAAGTWTAQSLDSTGFDYASLDNTGRNQYPGAVELADGSIWYAATRLNPALIRKDPLTTVWTPAQTTAPVLRGLFGSNVRGLASDGRGGAWFGAFPVFDGVTHWRADGSAVAYALRDSFPADANDLGWIQALKIAAYQDSRGDLWVSTFQNGVTRLRPSSNEDPATSEYLHLLPGDSPLQSRRVLAIAEDPKGRIWFASDGQLTPDDQLNVGLDILVDPGDPGNPASWTKVTPTNSQLAGPGVFAIDFLGADEVWLSVNGFGLQRWDYDGATGSGDIEASAMSDFNSWNLYDKLPDSSSGAEITAPRGVEFSADGRVWLATEGNGVFRFPVGDLLTSPAPWEVDQLRQTPFGVTLLSNQIRSIALDANGGLWAASEAGLDRVTVTNDGLQVDAFTDFASFESRALGQSYLPDILSPLPGSNVNTVVRAGTSVFIATQTGAARVDVDRLVAPGADAFDFSIHPNPVRGNDAGVVVAGFEGEATVEIYNLLGVRIVQRGNVRSGDQVWDTQNRLGEPVASGLYVVRVRTANGSSQRTVAIER